MPSHLRRHF